MRATVVDPSHTERDHGAPDGEPHARGLGGDEPIDEVHERAVEDGNWPEEDTEQMMPYVEVEHGLYGLGV